MTVKYGEMENLVTPTISIDMYKPKIGEVNETVVVAFEVAREHPAKDLSNLIETGIVETLDVDISTGPNEKNKYLVFVEFKRDGDLTKKIMEIIKTASNVTGIKEWKYNYYTGADTLELTEDNLNNTIITDSNEYVLKFNVKQQTNEELNRIKQLAGLT
jgi:hypothetical protein